MQQFDFMKGNRAVALAILTSVCVTNVIDRQVLGMLLPQIKTEFHLSDTALGLLAGPAFAIIYAVLGIPLGFLADRTNRRNVIGVSLAIFSAMTVLCGFATTFPSLLLTRFGTAIGEAGTAPAITSLIADLYPRSLRTGALAIYSSGVNLGLIIAFVGGGWIAQHEGWRAAFLLAGAPGLALIAILFVALKEPKRKQIIATDADGLLQTMFSIVKIPTFRLVALGAALISLGGSAEVSFIPSFLARSHHMSSTAIGMTMAATIGVLGFVGTASAGLLSRLLIKNAQASDLGMAAWSQFASLPFIIIFFGASNLSVALIGLAFLALLSGMYMGPGLSAIQQIVSPKATAQASACLFFVISLLGIGLGPQLVGFISDLSRPYLRADSLRFALLLTGIANLAAGYCFFKAAALLKLLHEKRGTDVPAILNSPV